MNASRRRAQRQRMHARDKEVYIMTARELTRVWTDAQRRKGFTAEEAAENFELLTGYAADSVVNLASPIVDATVLTRLAMDLRRGGGLLTTYRIIKRGNETMAALTGNAALRIHLTRSTYNQRHPKIIKMAVGPLGQRAMAIGGVLVTVVISPLIRGTQWIFDSAFTWHHLLGNVTMDLAKAVVAAGGIIVGGKMAVAGAGLSGIATPVIFPVIAGFIAAVVVGWGLTQLDDRFRITDRLMEALQQAQENWEKATEQTRREARYYFGTARGQLDFMRRFSGLR
ncbi:MAG: hypothetical protein WED00_05160 [Aquisalimonadaceae bacterium]